MPAGSFHCWLEDSVVSNTLKEKKRGISVLCALFLYQLVMIHALRVRDLWPLTAPPVPFLWRCTGASACRAVERVFTRIMTSARVSYVLGVSSPAAVNQCVYTGFCWAVLRSTHLRYWSFTLCWTGQWVAPVFACWFFSTLRKSKFLKYFLRSHPRDLVISGPFFFSLCCWNKRTLLPSFSWHLRGGWNSAHT